MKSKNEFQPNLKINLKIRLKIAYIALKVA